MSQHTATPPIQSTANVLDEVRACAEQLGGEAVEELHRYAGELRDRETTRAAQTPPGAPPRPFGPGKPDPGETRDVWHVSGWTISRNWDSGSVSWERDDGAWFTLKADGQREHCPADAGEMISGWPAEVGSRCLTEILDGWKQGIARSVERLSADQIFAVDQLLDLLRAAGPEPTAGLERFVHALDGPANSMAGPVDGSKLDQAFAAAAGAVETVTAAGNH